MKHIIKFINPVLVLLILVLPYSSCVKKEFDEPPVNGEDPALTVNTTIAQLKTLFTGSIVQISQDLIIAGVVIGDDASGNFYKSMVIQDTTAGINIQLDMGDYFRNYPVGRRVFVKCKGLYLGEYGDQIQLGGYVDNSSSPPSVGRIPLALVPQYLYGGVWGISVTPLTVNSIDQLNLTIDQNKLVTLQGVFFTSDHACRSWSEPTASGNREMQDIVGSNNTLTVRTSNFATFAANYTPSDTGTITGVFQRFNSTYQLVLRSLNDVQITSNHCCTNPTIISIDSVRKMYVTAPGTVTGECVGIRGIVISDRNNGNITYKNIMLQDNSTSEPRGIIVRFTTDNLTLNLGDEIEVDISRDSITKFNGALQVNYVDITKVKKLSSGNNVTPRVATIADINANFYDWESTLVKILNVTINGGAVSQYAGNKPLTDVTGGGVILYTSSGASFAGINHPASATSITGYLTPYNGTFELSIRNLNDVQP